MTVTKPQLKHIPLRSAGNPQGSSLSRRYRHVMHGICTLAVALACSIAVPAEAAERLILKLGPFEQSVPIADLEAFANTGELSPALKPFGVILTPQVQQLLSRRLQIDPNMIDKFVNDHLRTTDGQRLIDRLGVALPGSTIEELQAAIFLAARQIDGLSVVGFLRAYPEERVTVDASSALAIAIQFNASYLQSQALGPILERELTVPTENSFRATFDPAAEGNQWVNQDTVVLRDRSRQRTIPIDIYSNQNSSGPLVVISHGFGSDRKFLTYLGRHLASHGLTVVSIEHPGSNITWLTDVSVSDNPSDLLPASEFLDRPKDVSFVLDKLAQFNQEDGFWQGRFNTQQVSIIGHSLGGYTALSLAGAELNLDELRQFCQNRSPLGRSPADWFQCAAADLPNDKIQLRDPRIVQVLALNTISGRLFGKNGLAKVSVPTLILTGTEDAVTPSLDHQLRVFQQLSPGSKYLLSAIGGTHLSVTDPDNLNKSLTQSTLVKENIGEETAPLRQLVRGVSLAFIKQLTPEAEIYQPFLTPAYAQSLSTPQIALRLNTEFTASMEAWLNLL
jgi:predicted dienelactone hydrolase